MHSVKCILSNAFWYSVRPARAGREYYALASELNENVGWAAPPDDRAPVPLIYVPYDFLNNAKRPGGGPVEELCHVADTMFPHLGMLVRAHWCPRQRGG